MNSEIMRRIGEKVRGVLRFLQGWIMAPSFSKPDPGCGRVTDAQGPVWRDRDASAP
jgi:hypothetical protein